MPIISSLNINRITKDEYHKIDYVMMRLAYDIHNEFGRLNNENIYKHELAERCLKHGFDVKTEVKLTVCYKEFIKHLYMDIVINDSVVYELKAVRALVPFHQAQLLNYLMIAGMNYGKLINFGASSVEYKYVTSGLTVKDRYNFRFNIKSWNAADDKVVLFENICRSLVKEWGVFLSPSIFCER